MEKKDLKKIFNNEKKKIDKNVLIAGSGRWAKEIVKEINAHFPKIKNIFILTKYKKQFASWASKKIIKNIFFLSDLKEIKNINCNYGIIANKNKDHSKFSKYLLKNNFNILVEKPLFLNSTQYKKLVNLAYKKDNRVLISMQYMFAIYFDYLRKKIKSKNINNIKFLWFDQSKEFKNGLTKKHDLEINFTSDIFFHIYSILITLGIKQKITYFDKIKKINSYEKLIFGNKKLKIEVLSSRRSKTRKRVLEILLNDSSKLIVNFSKDLSLKVKINNKLITVPKNKLDTTLKYQLFFFLRNEQKYINISNNELKKLKLLFYYLEIINKK